MNRLHCNPLLIIGHRLSVIGHRIALHRLPITVHRLLFLLLVILVWPWAMTNEAQAQDTAVAVSPHLTGHILDAQEQPV
ncbi:MAG: hypothetical protein ACE5EY_13270, partial [Anaerolineae bacterium]